MQVQAIYSPRKIATQTIGPQGSTLVQALVACSPQARKLVDGSLSRSFVCNRISSDKNLELRLLLIKRHTASKPCQVHTTCGKHPGTFHASTAPREVQPKCRA